VKWAERGGVVALGTGVALTLFLALALAALDLRLYSEWSREIPPGLPGLIAALALAAGSFLVLGWRLRRGGRVRPAAYHGSLGLVLLATVVLVRQAVGLLLSDWSLSGSVVLGVNGLALGAVGFLAAPPARRELLLREEEPEDLRQEVETLVAEIQDLYRHLPPPARPLGSGRLVLEALVRPARAFGELRARPHLGLCLVVPLMVLLWPRLTLFARPGEPAGVLLLLALDYGLWLAFYDLGKALMLWGIARLLAQPLAYLSALTAFMIIDFPSLATYVVDHLWPGQYVAGPAGEYSQVGLGPLVAGLAQTNPALFEVLAKLDVHHAWTFLLWWVAFAVLPNVGRWVALLLTLVTFPGAHVFAWSAHLLLGVLRWE
jgi:hypothetical protein